MKPEYFMRVESCYGYRGIKDRLCYMTDSIQDKSISGVWLRAVDAEAEVASSIPHWASLTGAGFHDPFDPFQLCSSEMVIKIIIKISLYGFFSTSSLKDRFPWFGCKLKLLYGRGNAWFSLF